jgi:cephalosporin hydroxylase
VRSIGANGRGRAVKIPRAARRARASLQRRAPRIDELLLRLYRTLRPRPVRGAGVDPEAHEAVARLGKLGSGAVASSAAVDNAVVNAFRVLADADIAGRRRSPVVRRAVIDQFHRLYYHSPKRTWFNTRFLGVLVQKSPLDLWVYQEMIYELRPDVLVEAGTKYGGSAYYFARLFDLLGHGEVVTIDVQPQPTRPAHPRITYLTGSSTDPTIAEEVDRMIGNGKALVVLDSAHERDHVLAELRLWSRRVPVGSYLVVEDTHVDGHPVTTDFGPGPWDAVKLFLAENDSFEVDASRHKFFFTWNRGGCLRRIS